MTSARREMQLGDLVRRGQRLLMFLYVQRNMNFALDAACCLDPESGQIVTLTGGWDCNVNDPESCIEIISTVNDAVG